MRFEAPRLKGIEEIRTNGKADHAAVFELTFATSVSAAKDGV